MTNRLLQYPYWHTRENFKIPCSFQNAIANYDCRNSSSDLYSISQEICTRFLLCCGYTLTDFPISIRLTSLALWQSNDCPSASKATLMNMDKCFMWIHYERLHNHNKTVCIFLGIYCTWFWCKDLAPLAPLIRSLSGSGQGLLLRDQILQWQVMQLHSPESRTGGEWFLWERC